MQVALLSNIARRDSEAQQWFKVIAITGLILAVLFFLPDLYAADGTEFEDAATKFETWVKGNLGKLAALVAVAVGSVVAAVRKDWSWFFGAMVLSIGIGIVVGIVNASFTAVI